MKFKYLDENYKPKGQLKGFPLEIINKMVEEQVRQGNEPNVRIFENAIYDGFDWEKSTQGKEFWAEVLFQKNFKLFFEKYPKEKTFPRIIEVYNDVIRKWVKRNCIAIIDNMAVCLFEDETLNKQELNRVFYWNKWREIEEYKPFDFKTVEEAKFLLGKVIKSKDGECIETIHKIGIDENKELTINDESIEYFFSEFTFEDGTPFGQKI